MPTEHVIEPIPDSIGCHILKIITSGMYTDPLALYREYIQNAVDSLASNSDAQPGEVQITLDRAQSKISIRDNGAGLSREQALQNLVPISRSLKEVNGNRGFRGIGRLVGLVFGESIKFYTRQKGDQNVFAISWDGNRLESGIASSASIDEIISKSVTTESIVGDEYPEHFFEVQISGISRYAASTLFNVDVVRNYLGEVCPVPFDDQFSYRTDINSILRKDPRFSAINIYLNAEEPAIITKHLSSELFFPNGDSIEIERLEEINVPALSIDSFAAIGWVAHWAYSGAIPKTLGVRGIRARIGNMQIGDECVFDHLFTESRFNRWSVGEVHIVDPHILPNAKRDYFEPSPHLRNLENHLGVICRKLENNCRSASKFRNRRKKIYKTLDDLNSSYKLAASGLLSRELVEAIKEDAESKIQILKNENYGENDDEMLSKLSELEKRYQALLKNYRKRFNGTAIDDKALPLNDVFSAIVNVLPSHATAHQTIESILNEFRNQGKSLDNG